MHTDAVEIDLLGRFAVRAEGREVGTGEFGGRLVRRLVRILAVQRGRVVTRDALIDALWGDKAPADPAANLNVLVNRARRAFGEGWLIETVAGGYLMPADADVVVDIETFEASVSQAREALDRGDASAASSAVEAGLTLWPGEPLPEDTYAEWAAPHRDRLDRAYQEALELGASAALATGAPRRATDLAAAAVSRQPLREAAHLLLVRALVASGDQAAALTAYERLRRTLAEELGIDPSPDAAELHRRLLRGELRSERPTRHLLAGQAPFVGREAELEALSRLDGDRRVALVAGRSGSGKSRLLDELSLRTDRYVLAARAVLPEREAPWSLARALLQSAVNGGVDVAALLPPRTVASLADLLPRLDAAAVSVDPQTWRALVLQGAVRILHAAGPVLIVVDDLQWADSSSLDLLTLLAGHGQELALVLAYRPEEVGEGSPLAHFLAQIRGTARPIQVRLGRIMADAIGRLVASPAVASMLAEHTDGTPFAVLEVLRDLDREDVLRLGRSGVWHVTGHDALKRARLAARAGQQRAIWARTERQPGTRRDLLGLLALLGRPAPARLFAPATGTAADEVLGELYELARAELVRHDPRGFAVAHDLVGETVRDRLGAVERARLHQLLARALEEEAAPADELARHLAGAGDLAAAAAAYVTAAAQRLDRFADREAEHLASEGLSLEPASQVRGSLLEIRAETRARRGDFSGARDDLRAALTSAATSATRARLLARLAALAFGTEDLLRASDLVGLALAEAGDDPGARARALYVAALVDMNLQHPERAEARFVAAQSLFSQVGDGRGVADILDARAMAMFLDGHIDEAGEAFERVSQLFADSGNLLRVVTPQSTRGHALVFAGKPDEGLAEVDSALELARSLGYAEGEAMALWHRSEALVGCGRAAEALDAADAAVSTAGRVGHRGWTATGLRARGISLQALGDPAAAEDAFRRSLQTSVRFPLFASWAHARLALVLVSRGQLAEAAQHAEEALLTGPPLAHYEARLARCEVAVARPEPDAAALIAVAMKSAIAGGHRWSLPRLIELRHLTGA